MGWWPGTYKQTLSLEFDQAASFRLWPLNQLNAVPGRIDREPEDGPVFCSTSTKSVAK
jgi:hypothetical protein